MSITPMIKKTVLLIFMISLLGPNYSNNGLSYALAPNGTYFPDDEWRTSSLEDQNMDPNKIQEAKDYIDKNEKLITSMTIVRNGYLVEEEYFGWSISGALNPLYSVTKSIVTTLMGIAI